VAISFVKMKTARRALKRGKKKALKQFTALNKPKPFSASCSNGYPKRAHFFGGAKPEFRGMKAYLTRVSKVDL